MEPGRPSEGQLVVRQVALSQLTPWKQNPRTITQEELKKLERSIQQFGFVQPVVVRRQDRQLIAGHQRVAAARALGMATVPAVMMDLSPEQTQLLALALNRIGGEWDLPRLGAILEELRQLPKIDVTLSGFGEAEVERLLSDLERAQLPAPYEESAAEAFDHQRLHAPTRVSPGETWRLGRHLLHCGDSLQEGCLARLLEGRKVDHLLSDPPYGISFEGLARRGRRKGPIRNDEAERFPDFLARAIPALRAVMAPGSVLHLFCGASGPRPVLAHALLAVAEHFTLQGLLIWDRVDPGLGWRWRRSFEGIIEASVGKPRVWSGGRELRDILRFPRAIPGAEAHPTPKPVALLEQLIRAVAPTRGLILDPFVGAGTSIIAAERTGRNCVAVEIEPRWCDLALARWETLAEERAMPVEKRGGPR
jgi:DNA modification methylase